MRAIGYVRVSTEKQGLSLEAQVAKIQASSILKDADLIDIIRDDDQSAKNIKRPGMMRLLELVDSRTVDTVIIAKLDRLTRSVKDLAELLELFNRRQVALVSVAESLDTDSAAGRLVLNIMMAVSQWEREAIGERTRDALQHKKAKGERVGTIPYGCCLSPISKKLETNPHEQKVLHNIHEMQKLGGSTRQIANQLNKMGYRTRSGNPWRHEYVARILRNAA